MSVKISGEKYAMMYGPTTGDKVRLADTDLIIEVEKDYTTYGDEIKFGGGKTINAFAGVHAYYNHGNQPNLHISALFNFSGKPWLSQKWMRTICNEFYGTEEIHGYGYGQDEDQGQLGAWYVMASMGLFDAKGLTAPDPTFQIGSPLFDKVTIYIEEDDEEQTVTRRRRRRRGGKNGEGTDDQSQNSEQPLVRRSRKQQYIDEITDVEGSTRLEAKKQRRRDNRRERSRQSQLMEQDFLARRENVDRLMVVREKEHHTQISVVEDNVLVEHYVSDIQEVQTVGNIYLGRVQNVLPSMEAAFVDIGQARNGVLYAGEVNWDAARLEGQPRRIELAFKSGDPVLVQVTKDPIGHKGARLTSQITLAGRYLVLIPGGSMMGISRKLPVPGARAIRRHDRREPQAFGARTQPSEEHRLQDRPERHGRDYPYRS